MRKLDKWKRNMDAWFIRKNEFRIEINMNVENNDDHEWKSLPNIGWVSSDHV